MPKLTLTDETSGFATTTARNANYTLIENEFEKVLYRNDDSGDSSPMQQELDMNSNKILNVATGVANSDAANVGQVGTAITAAVSALDSGVTGAANLDYNPGITGSVVRTVETWMRERELSVKDLGAVGDGVTDDTAAIQKAIDEVNSSYLGGTFGGRGGIVFLPANQYKITGLIIKKGVSLIGEGQANTVLLLNTDGGTGIKTPAKASQAAGDVVAQSVLKGMTFGIHPDLTPTVLTILLDSTGLTKCTFNDLAFECPSNVIGCDNTGNTLAGSGGPAHWYNTWIHPFFNVSGGIGIRWGDSDVATEQVTAQTVIGGRIGGTSGTGMHIRGGTGNNFHGTSFEGLNSGGNNTIIFGSPSGSRVTTSNNFHGCYLEQAKVTYNTNTNRNRRYGGLETSVTEVDTGNRNGRVDNEQLYRGWPRVYVSGRVTTPTTINKSYNVNTGTGITRVSAGVFEIPFSITMPDINYIAMAASETDNLTARVSTKTTTTVRFVFFDTAGTATDPTSFTFTVTDNDS